MFTVNRVFYLTGERRYTSELNTARRCGPANGAPACWEWGHIAKHSNINTADMYWSVDLYVDI